MIDKRIFLLAAEIHTAVKLTNSVPAVGSMENMRDGSFPLLKDIDQSFGPFTASASLNFALSNEFKLSCYTGTCEALAMEAFEAFKTSLSLDRSTPSGHVGNRIPNRLCLTVYLSSNAP